MATAQIITRRFDFTESELAAAMILPEPFRNLIETYIAGERMRYENLKPDPNNYAVFIQESAEIKGAIIAYQFLLNNHDDVVARLANLQPYERG